MSFKCSLPCGGLVLSSAKFPRANMLLYILLATVMLMQSKDVGIRRLSMQGGTKYRLSAADKLGISAIVILLVAELALIARSGLIS
jgi:hypothetical protein